MTSESMLAHHGSQVESNVSSPIYNIPESCDGGSPELTTHPERDTPGRATPESTTPAPIPGRTTPDRTLPDRVTPTRGTPVTNPARVTPVRATSARSTSGATLERVTSDRDVPAVIPGRDTSGRGVPVRDASANATRGRATRAPARKTKRSGRCGHVNTELVAFASAYDDNCVKCTDCDVQVRACVRCLTYVTSTNFARHRKKCVGSKYELLLGGPVGSRKRERGGKFSSKKNRKPRRPGRGKSMELIHPLQ